MKKVCIFILILFMILLTGCNEPNQDLNKQQQKFFEIFNNDLIPVINNDGVYQYINYKEQNPFNETYEYATEFLNDSAVVRKNKKDYLVNKNGEIISDKYDYIDSITNYYPLGSFYDNNWVLYRARKGDIIHLLDEYGKRFTQYEFRYLYPGIHSNMILGDTNEGAVVINRKGETIITFTDIRVVTIDDFNNIRVTKRNQKVDLYDNEGNILFSDCDSIYTVCENIFHIKKDGISQYLNEKKEVLFEEYDDIYTSLKEYGKTDIVIFGKQNDLWYEINKNGEKLTGIGYPKLFLYTENFLVILNDDGTRSIYNRKNELIGGKIFSDYKETNVDPYIVCKNNVNNASGKFITIYVYDQNNNLLYERTEELDISDAIIADKITGKLYTRINNDDENELCEIIDGNLVPMNISKVKRVYNDLISYVNEDGTYNVVTYDGKELVKNSKIAPYIYDNFILYEKNGCLGLLNSKGEEIVSPQYNLIPSIKSSPNL